MEAVWHTLPSPAASAQAGDNEVEFFWDTLRGVCAAMLDAQASAPWPSVVVATPPQTALAMCRAVLCAVGAYCPVSQRFLCGTTCRRITCCGVVPLDMNTQQAFAEALLAAGKWGLLLHYVDVWSRGACGVLGKEAASAFTASEPPLHLKRRHFGRLFCSLVRVSSANCLQA